MDLRQEMSGLLGSQRRQVESELQKWLSIRKGQGGGFVFAAWRTAASIHGYMHLAKVMLWPAFR